MKVRTDNFIRDWTIEYDHECDTLYFAKFPLPLGAKLYYVEGIHYYVSKNKIVGVMIEYFFTQAIKGLKNY